MQPMLMLVDQGGVADSQFIPLHSHNQAGSFPKSKETSLLTQLFLPLIRSDLRCLLNAWSHSGGTLDSSYPGGLAAYIANARKLLADSRDGKNPSKATLPQ